MKKIIHLAFSIVLSISTYAQGIYNNGAQIVLNSGSYLYIDGDANGNYLNASSGGNHGYINNDGTIIIEGDWTNNATSGNVFTSLNGTGTVEFRGTTIQNVGGTAITVFEDITINNTAGGTAVAWNNNSQVSSTLNLTDGIVTTGANYLIHTATSAAETVGGSSASFIYGNYRRYIASNTSTYEFPLGKGTAATDYHPAAFVNNNLTGVTYLDTKVGSITEAGAEVDGNIATSQNGTPIVDARAETAEWTITPNAAATGGNYGIKLYLNNISGLTDDQFCVIKRPDASTSYADWATLDATTTIPAPGTAGRTVASNYALRTGYTSFSRFTIGTSNVPLPVELLAFNVNCENNNAVASWQTASEIENDYFVLEISPNNQTYEALAIVEGNGTSTDKSEYQYTLGGINYPVYIRLVQVDVNGKQNILSTVHYQPCHNNLEWNVTSYSFDERIIVNIQSPVQENINLVLFDNIGRQIFADQINVTNGQNQYVIDKNIATGVYLLNIFSDNYWSSHKLWVK